MKLLTILISLSSFLVFAEPNHRTNTTSAGRNSTKLSDKAANTLEGIFVLADDIEVVHTTRDIAPSMKEGFPAGRYAIVLKASGEEKRFLVLQTENLVGHLKPVVPGKTKVDGFVSVMQNRQDLYGDNAKGEQLQTQQLRKLCIRLVRLWGKPEKVKNANEKLTLQALLAIYTNGNSEALEKIYKEAAEK